MENKPAGSLHQVPVSASPLVVATPSSDPHSRSYPAIGAERAVVVPSLLMCDFGHLADEVAKLEAAGVRAVHLDVMDGHFVPNLTYGMPIVAAVRKLTSLPIEAHIMISEPAKYAEQIFDAGADAVTFHFEAVDDPAPLLKRLRAIGASAGLAYNPSTPLDAIRPYLHDCDIVLTMSVHPGFGGQHFDPVALDKLRALRSLVAPHVLLEVDGGVNAETIAACTKAGARALVVGSAIFAHPDYNRTIAALQGLAAVPEKDQ